MKRAIIFFVFVVTAILPSVAQKYIVDDNFADSMSVYNISVCEGDTTETLEAEAFKLPMGDVVEVTRLLKGQKRYGAIEVDGKEYGVEKRYLLFSEDNADGVEDIFKNTRDAVQHSWAGKFFATFTPYAIVAILFIAAMGFMFIGYKSAATRRLTLYVVPGCVLIASLIEIWAYITLGTDAFWWCSMDRYGFFGSLFRAIPFVAFVAFQLYSIKLYERLLLGENSDQKLSIKPMAISLAICIPVALVLIFGLTSLGLDGAIRDILVVVAFLGSLFAGILISYRKNAKALGATAGLAFTVFGIVYIIGSIIAIIGLAIVIFEIILQILTILVAMFALSFAMKSGGNGGKQCKGAAWQNADGTWSNGSGIRYGSEAEARSH